MTKNLRYRRFFFFSLKVFENSKAFLNIRKKITVFVFTFLFKYYIILINYNGKKV